MSLIGKYEREFEEMERVLSGQDSHLDLSTVESGNSSQPQHGREVEKARNEENWNAKQNYNFNKRLENMPEDKRRGIIKRERRKKMGEASPKQRFEKRINQAERRTDVAVSTYNATSQGTYVRLDQIVTSQSTSSSTVTFTSQIGSSEPQYPLIADKMHEAQLKRARQVLGDAYSTIIRDLTQDFKVSEGEVLDKFIESGLFNVGTGDKRFDNLYRQLISDLEELHYSRQDFPETRGLFRFRPRSELKEKAEIKRHQREYAQNR